MPNDEEWAEAQALIDCDQQDAEDEQVGREAMLREAWLSRRRAYLELQIVHAALRRGEDLETFILNRMEYSGLASAHASAELHRARRSIRENLPPGQHSGMELDEESVRYWSDYRAGD